MDYYLDDEDFEVGVQEDSIEDHSQLEVSK